MDTVEVAGQQVSRLMLGTVQFGMPYGIANRTGQPDYAAVRAILASAAEAGVNALDTAAAYGTSEAILGQALAELRLADRMLVVTKIAALTPAERASPAAAARAITAGIHQSRRRLRLDVLPMVLFHRDEDFACVEALLDLQARGFVRHMGASCGHLPSGAMAVLASGRAAALQLPVNLLDRRHVTGGVPCAAAARGVAVFVRSVYLQGLLLMTGETVPAPLRALIPVRAAFARLAAAAGMELAELAVRYALSLDGVACVVMGVDSLDQLRANVALVERGPLDPALLREVAAIPVSLPDEVITPALWAR